MIESLERRVLFAVTPGRVTDVEAETLARVTAYENGLTVGASALAGSDYVVEHIFNNKRDGFQALGLTSPTEAPVLVLRGTNDAKDVVADANRLGVGYNQFVDNWSGGKGVEAWLNSISQAAPDNAGGSVDIVGHSLGGALAQWIAAAYTHLGHPVGRVVTFNSPGISATYARRFNPTLSLGVTDYIADGDIVSMAGQAFIAGQYDLVHYSSESELAPSIESIFNWELTKHTTPMLTSAGGTVPADETIDASLPTSGNLNSKSFVYADAEYSQMLQDLTTAVAQLPSPYRQEYRKLPTALRSRQQTEAVRPALFKLLFSNAI
jgi:hypothetical protein